ncbi:hypothetical protein SAMN05421736_11252 [Evansella caseinilytica]|uniref:GyrI-like small molecule binding domain-containing protein n=1 Tax=Evansella caseinilytica TaxID=1503961 RepID=A0A1H3SVU4_9BACI|nr:GyrI-like domain-containing protein [Evansella caseinilytica]SDZ41671.1 hypothetical protein SAMN05421736_11252 [Evansella caseinilytica]
MKAVAKQTMPHDHRRLYPEIYQLKPGSAVIQYIPKLQFISQEMITAYNMEWAGRPEPLDEQWLAWKVVNQLKQIAKMELDYRFKLMPYEIVWHQYENKKWHVTQMMQIPELITEEMFERARLRVRNNLRDQALPDMQFVAAEAALCAQKLHVGHYKETNRTLSELKQFVEEQGFEIIGDHREIYLTPATDCHPPATWKTIVRVELGERRLPPGGV